MTTTTTTAATNAPTTNAPRYVELIRVSSRGQAERDTPEDQRRALDTLRKTRPGIFVERIDQAISGAKDTAARTDLQRLFALADARAFDEIRIRHVDRLTRHADPSERFAVFGAIRDAGAVVVEASGRVIDPADEMGELDLSLQGWFAAREKKRIVERTMAAKRRLAAEGRLAPTSVPWGRRWDREAGRWDVNPEANNYRRMFDLALAGRTLSEIAQTLTVEGIKPPRGERWSTGNTWNLLAAPHAGGRWRSHGSETAIPAIVDPETQAAALAILRSHDHAGGAHVRHPALLRKILSCAVCGAPCHTNRNTGPTARVFYHCAGDRSHGTHDVAAVDAAVRARLAAWARRPGAIAAAAGEDDGGGAEAARRDAQRDLADATRDLRGLDLEEERHGRLVVRGSLSPRVADKLFQEIVTRRRAATEQAAGAKARIAAAERRAEMAATETERITELRARIDRFTDGDWRELIELIFPRAGGYTVAISPDGTITMKGALPVDDVGAEAVRNARESRPGNPPPPSRTS